MSETKRFHLRVVLTVSTGRLLTKSPGPGDNGISDLYELLNWMTNDDLYTHQLPRASRECKPWLFQWFPGLQKANDALDELDIMIASVDPETACQLWVDTLIAGGQPEFFDVPRIPRDDHEFKNPIDELIQMRGTDKGIVVVDIGDA